MAGLDNLRHSTSHLLASAVLSLFPKAKPTLGPPIEERFYYDFADLIISEEDLPKIEAKMKQIVSSWTKFEKISVSASEAKNFFKGNPFKLELIKEFENDKQKITLYKSGDFVDLCRGGHVVNPSKEIKHFKLLSVAGAYWRGDEKNAMLTRIYGTVFPSQKELDEYFANLEEAKKRDHRKIGKELELFIFEDIAPGAPFWLPKGMIIVKELEKLWREIHEERGYQEISTPIMVKSEVFEISGHFEHYKHHMFNLILGKGVSYSLKPMNCPESTYVYASKTRGHKDLPLRYSEIGRLHRREKGGELGGLLRVKQITMDDAHIYTAPQDIQKEIDGVLDLVEYFYQMFGFKPIYNLSTRPDKFMGDNRLWAQAEKSLSSALRERKINYIMKEGEGAFYGPKIDIQIKDALGRSWQLATIQLDFQMPLRFKLKYTDKDGSQKTPVIIHRAIFGSFERFIGILIEHYGGAFPVWLSPVHVKILPITDKNLKYAKSVSEALSKENIRTEVDERSETLQAKIRDAQLSKVPYMLIVGSKEQEASSVSVRKRSGKDLGAVALTKFVSEIKEEIRTKALS